MRALVRKFIPLSAAILFSLPLPAAGQGMHGGPSMMAMPAVRYELASDTVFVPFRLNTGHIVVDATIDGKGPFPFIFDTGAHGSVMDLQFAKEQGFELGQEVMVGSPNGGGRPGNLTTLAKFQIGGLTLSGLPSVAFDGLPFPRGADSPRGVIGPYSLHGLLISLDYRRERLVFTRGALPAPDGREIFAWDARDRLPLIQIGVAGHPIRVHVDAGAMNGLSLPVEMATQLPLASPPVEMGEAKLVDRVVPLTGAALKGTVTIGRYTLENPSLRFGDHLKTDGNLGPPILRQFLVTIDPANTRLRLAGPADGKLAMPVEPAP
jgi:hypothetical protein